VDTFCIAINSATIAHQGKETDRLLSVLHDNGLSASKMGCGSGHCGACTLWIDGAAVRSCDVTVGSICATRSSSARIVTSLEGLAEREPKLAQCLVDAFVKEQAAQCGYCTSGILMKAAFLILNRVGSSEKSNLEPLSKIEIARALDDHLCRCGSHLRVVRAVQLASDWYVKA
jgi:nicotinate dehydrogenase subunit A